MPPVCIKDSALRQENVFLRMGLCLRPSSHASLITFHSSPPISLTSLMLPAKLPTDENVAPPRGGPIAPAVAFGFVHPPVRQKAGRRCPFHPPHGTGLDVPRGGPARDPIHRNHQYL